MGISQNIPGCVTGDDKASAYATMSFLGISCLHAWIFGINTSGESASPSIAWQWTYVALAAFMLLASTAMPKRAECLSRKLDSAAALIGAASTIALALVAVFGASEILQITGIVGVGASLGWMYLRWGQFYAKLDIRNAACALFLSGAIGSCIKSALFVASAPLMWIALAALPIASAILCSSAYRTLERQEPAEPTRMYFESHSLSAFAKVFVVFVVFSLANGFILAIQSGSPSQAGTAPFMIARAAEIALCTAVLVYAFKFNKTFDFAQLWRVILVILSSAILLSIILPEAGISQAVSSVSVNFVVLFVWLTLADIARHSSMGAMRVFGIGWSCYALPLFAGWLLSCWLDGEPDKTAGLSIVLYAVSIASAFCLEVRDRDMKAIFCDLNPEKLPSPSDFADIDGRCAAIAERYSLTARELEVMQLLCKGRSKSYIAESLFVTENTVKGHAKRLYAKLDVHSRKELQQMIDAW